MKELLKFFYNDEMLHQREIAEIFGVSHHTISERMAKFGIPTRLSIGPGYLNGNWKGGRKVQNRRIYHWMPDHPNADKKGYVKEEWLVLESILCDFLPRSSVVHHFNKDSLDNRPENLMYFDGQSGHMGHHQRKKRRLAKERRNKHG